MYQFIETPYTMIDMDYKIINLFRYTMILGFLLICYGFINDQWAMLSVSRQLVDSASRSGSKLAEERQNIKLSAAPITTVRGAWRIFFFDFSGLILNEVLVIVKR